MATTTIMTVHVNKGKTPKQCVAAQLNYIMNPAKTNSSALISSHACMPETAVNEFMLYRQEYLSISKTPAGKTKMRFWFIMSAKHSSRKRSRRRKQMRSEKSWRPA